MSTTYRVADMTIDRIVEQQGAFAKIGDFLPAATPELVDANRAWMQPSYVDAEDRLLLCFQSYVIRTPHHTILVDSCIGNDKDRATRPAWHRKTDPTYMTALAAAGVGVDDIDFVLCTHLHVAHVGWNTRLDNGRWVPTFPKARYLFSARELAFWTERHAIDPIPAIADSVLPIVAAQRADLVDSSHVLSDHVRLLPTPGHTPDHFAVALGRGRDVAVLTGDLIHTPLQMRYPELSMMADTDRTRSAMTRRSFLERYCDTDTLCCTAHFPSPSVNRISRWDAGFKCEPVSHR
jgi:glyoxylase-like metal-dependent hydrolase (beta-lactamase superfamily II)